MQGLAHVNFDSNVGISSAYSIGELMFKQSEALAISTIARNTYNISIFDESMDNSYNILKLLNEYNARNGIFLRKVLCLMVL